MCLHARCCFEFFDPLLHQPVFYVLSGFAQMLLFCRWLQHCSGTFVLTYFIKVFDINWNSCWIIDWVPLLCILETYCQKLAECSGINLIVSLSAVIRKHDRRCWSMRSTYVKWVLLICWGNNTVVILTVVVCFHLHRTVLVANNKCCRMLLCNASSLSAFSFRRLTITLTLSLTLNPHFFTTFAQTTRLLLLETNVLQIILNIKDVCNFPSHKHY